MGILKHVILKAILYPKLFNFNYFLIQTLFKKVALIVQILNFWAFMILS